MTSNASETGGQLQEVLKYLGFTSGLRLNETESQVPIKSIWPSVLNLIPLSLGVVGLIFNILALLIFTASRTFRQSPFRCYIYAFVLVNCASILSHSWLYLVFYIVEPVRLCKYIQFLQQSLSTASLWIMVLLSCERSFTFIRPFTVKHVLKSRTVYFIIISVICSCFVLHIDELIFVDIKAFRWVNFAYGICSIKRRSILTMERIKIITHSHAFILPFLLNSILVIYICYKICQRRQRILQKKLSILKNSKFRRSKISLANEITLTLLWQSTWLLITYFPTHLYYFLISFNFMHDHDRDNSTLVFLIRQNLLIYLAFSPTLYVILSPTLRREIRIQVTRTYKQRRNTNSSYVSVTNKKVDKFLNDDRQPRLTILITKSEELPRKFPLTTTIMKSNKLFNQYESKSTPCLSVYTNKHEYYQHMKTERSSTLMH
ncbi:unnamed protein product [Adineta steineri]|nr:unnamed protein product [Adineta steineri]CAF1226449.1 unnamed protein product [Adineta steineri]CAF1258470.1 unnamed protein product [Adineta steineri]